MCFYAAFTYSILLSPALVSVVAENAIEKQLAREVKAATPDGFVCSTFNDDDAAEAQQRLKL